MNKFVFILLTVVCLLAFGCGKKTELTDISNSITDKHFNIPKTRLYVIPPQGYLSDKETSAIWKDSTGIIQVLDVVNADFESCTLNLGKKGFEALGTKVLAYNELKVGGYFGRISIVDGYIAGRPNFQSYYLVFGDSSFCTLVVGSYLRGNKEAQKQVLEALKTICYVNSKNIPAPFETVCFELDDSKSILKFVNYTGSAFLYTRNGEDKADAYPMLTVLSSPQTALSINQAVETIFKQLNKNGVRILKKEYENIGRTNGFESYQSECQIQIDNLDYSMFMHIVMIDKYLILMQGFADRYDTQSMKEIIKLTNTISRKKSTGHNTSKTTSA